MFKNYNKTTILILMFLTVLIGSFFIYYINADDPLPHSEENPKLGSANITSELKWIVTSKTGTEFQLTFWTLDGKDKKTELGWIPPDNDCTSWEEMNLFDENNNEILDDKSKTILLKCESSKCDGQNCYHISLTNVEAVNIDEYVRLGNNSIVTEYQNQSKIEYNYSWGSTNITLLNEGEISSDIFVYYNNVSYKFGANDTNNPSIENYTYKLESTTHLKQKGYKLYSESPNFIETENEAYFPTQDFDFSDICNRNFECGNVTEEEITYEVCNYTASCEFSNYVNNSLYVYEIDFISDKNIDPEIKNGTIKIKITNAIHLNSTKGFMENIFDYVRTYDNNYTEYIPVGDYVRVTFEKNLSAGNDITIVANSNATANIEIYEVSNEIVNRTFIATINNINGVNVYKTYLGGLNGSSQDTFDLKILDNPIKFDYIVDPVDVPTGYNLLNDSLNLGVIEAIDGSQLGVAYDVYNLAQREFSGGSNQEWVSASTTNENVTINFTDSYEFDTIEVFEGFEDNYDASPNNTNIYVSDDAVTWTRVGDTFSLFGAVPTITGQFDYINISLQNKRYLRLEFLDNWGDGSYISVAEIKVYKNATNLAILDTTEVIITHISSGTANDTRDDLFDTSNDWYTSTSNPNITWDFSEAKRFNSIEFSTYIDAGDYRPSNISILVSDDGSSWTEVYSNDYINESITLLGYGIINFTVQDKQYLRLNILEDSGGNGIVASEIRIWEDAEAGVVDDPPTSILSLPDDFNETEQGIITFECNATDDLMLENVTLYVWNSTGGIITTETKIWNGTFNTTTFDFEFKFDNVTHWNCLVNDNSSQEDWADANFTLNITSAVADTVFPDLNITFPINNTNYSSNIININYSVSDDVALDTCWYSNDSMSENTTLADCETNITDVTWIEGQHNVTIWANDTSDNINISTVTFIIDTIPPDLNITTPINNSFLSNETIDVNYTTSDFGLGLNTCWYSNDTYSTNTTLTNCETNITDIVWNEGEHNVTLWVNDTLNNINKTGVTFTIDTTAPIINITFPTNYTNTSDTTIPINYSFIEINPDTCWYTNDSEELNTTITCGENITDISWSEGTHTVTIWINDSANNEDKASVNFSIDSTAPECTLISVSP